jgi:hypothetical protein
MAGRGFVNRALNPVSCFAEKVFESFLVPFLVKTHLDSSLILLAAIRSQNVELVEMGLHSGRFCIKDGTTLCAAAGVGDSGIVDRVLAMNADRTIPDLVGDTPFVTAA